MRNLKKVLSLALASVMLLGMMVVGTSAASFTDVDDSHNAEAIEVMKMAGVMIGTDGKFNPDKNVTRNEMAVIMSNLLGLKIEDYKGTSPFTDVPAWAEPYVAACYANGIVSGTSATTYGGEGAVTTAQASLMLMKALGYFQYASDFGADWQVATIKQGSKIKLFEGVETSATAALTRNEVAQLALNTLKANVVDAQGQDGVKVEGDGFTVTTGSTVNYVPVTNALTDDYRVAGDTDRDTNEQLVEKLFKGDLKKDTQTETSDDFGREGYTWTWKNDESLFVMDAPVATFTAKTKAADVAKALAGYKFVAGGNTYKVNNVNKYANNTTLGSYDWTRNNSGTTWTTSLDSVLKTNAADQTVAARLASLTKNGRVVEVYADKDAKIVDIVMIDYKTVEAGKVTTNKTTGDITYVVDGVNYYDYADEDVADTIALVEELEKGDIITFVKANGVAYVTPTTSFQAAQSATKTSDSVQTITLDGTAYTVSNFAKSGTTFSNSTTVYNYFVDQYGYIVHTSSTAKASTDYAYVIETEAKVETSALASAAVTLKAKVVLADGTVAVYPVELKKNDAGDYYIKNIGGDSNIIFDKSEQDLYEADRVNNLANQQTSAVATAAAQGDIKNLTFGYTLTDGVITFEALTALPANGTNTAEKTVYVKTAADTVDKVTSVTLNTDKKALIDSKTIFVAYNSTKDEAKVYTGMSALPTAITSLTSANDTYVLKTGTTNKVGTAQVVFFTYAAANHLAADATTDYYFVDNTKYSTVMVDGKNQTQYTAYAADGTTKTLIAASSAPSAAALYTPDKDDKITGSGLSGARYIDATSNKMVDAGEMIGVAGTYYYVTEKTSVVYVDDTLTELNDNQAWIVLELDGSTVTSNIETIFVIGD